MSKSLIIARHAKSSWAQAGMADIDRPLKKRGFRDAQLMGGWLNNYCSDKRIHDIRQLASPASRAQLTAQLITEPLTGIVIVRETVDSLYLADMQKLLEVIQSQNDDRLLLVGHNPGLHTLVELYSGRYLKKFPTCAIACFEFDTDNWKAACSDNCVDYSLVRPKDLRED